MDLLMNFMKMDVYYMKVKLKMDLEKEKENFLINVAV